MRLGVSPTASTPQVFSVRGLRLYFPMLRPWVVWSASLPSYSSCFICSRMWDLLVQVLQLPPCCEFFLPGCPSPPLRPVWMNVSSLTLWWLHFHTVQVSGSSNCFLFLNLSLSFFWLWEEAQWIFQCLHLGQKSHYLYFLFV